MPAYRVKLTKKQKGYFAVLAVAVAALVINYAFFSSSPKAAVAADVSMTEQPVNETASHPETKAPPNRSSSRNLSATLQRLSDDSGDSILISDAFKPSESWLSDKSVGTTHHGFDPAAAKAFSDVHQLKVIFKSNVGGQAIVNGRLVRPGDKLDGFQLESVSTHSVRFTSSNTFVDLHLPGDDSNGESADSQ